MTDRHKEHAYSVVIDWTGIKQGTTESYTSYSREFMIHCEGKPDMLGSSDPAFRGDPKLYNPEEMLLASISSCHMLWYLHLCAVNHIHILSYQDNATGVLMESKEGGRFTQVVLSPSVVIKKDNDQKLALQLHEEAHKQCFIANSVNFPIKCVANILT
jgi:organic hydroperoxide reductase OsmC/OhrA